MRLIDAPRVSKHLISQAARARQQTPRLDGPAFPNSRDRTDLSFGEGRASPPLHLSGERETRRRNEVANGQENQTVGPHLRNSMEKRDCQWSRKSCSGCPLRRCSWLCLGAPSRVTKYRWTLWFVRASSWGSWCYSSSNTK